MILNVTLNQSLFLRGAAALVLATTSLATHAAPPSTGPRGPEAAPAPGARIKTPAAAPATNPLDSNGLAANRAQAQPLQPDAANTKRASAKTNPFKLDHVLFDEPGDGAMWVSGNTYKARFGADGFTYIPRLGSSAPRNFPIAFSLEQVTLDGQSLDLNTATPARHGDTVTFNRGAIRESYALAPDSVEQTFTLDSRPGIGGAGPMTIRMQVQTELPISENADGFVFAHELGSVTYSRAVVVDAAARRTQVPTRLIERSAISGQQSGDRLIEIELPESLLESAAYPIVVDPIIQTNLIEAGFADRWPDVAYDPGSDTFCVVLEEHVSSIDGDVWTYRMNGTTGALLSFSLAVIDNTATNWRHPKIAGNDFNNNYLVVAEVGLSPNRIIRGRTVSATANTTGAVFNIGDTVNYPGDQVHCDVGGDPYGTAPVYYFVVWQNEFSASDHDILGRLVNPSGSVSGSVIEVDYSGADDFNPAISKGNGTDTWTIVWDRIQSILDHNIYAARRAWDGSLINAPFVVDNSNGDCRNPRVSTPMSDGANAIVYQEEPAGGGQVQIHCKVFNGTSVAGQGYITGMDGVTAHTRNPVVDANSSQFVVAYEELFAGPPADWDLYASTYCYLGNSIVPAEKHRRLAYTFQDDSHVMIASKHSAGGNPNRALIVWAQLTNGFGDLWNSMYQIPASCCPHDTNHNGVTDVDDLLAVISSWGTCINCNADINGDTVVDVDDLLAVIGGWGPCS